MNHDWDDVPPGWDASPSAWPDRRRLVVLAIAGSVVATYLALYQSGVFATVFEPFFGNGAREVLHSPVSTLLPVPDAAVGAVAYIGDVATGLPGGRDRWRTMPWVVLLFGLFVVATTGASVVLTILQVAVFHEWCTLCLTSAAISIVIFGPAMSEVLATLQHLARRLRAGSGIVPALAGRTG